MKIVIKKITFSELLAYLALVIFLLVSIFDTSFFARYIPLLVHKGLLALSAILLLVREVFYSKYSLKNIIGFVLATILIFSAGFGSSFVSTLTISIILIYCLRDFQLENLAKVTLVVTLISFIIIIASSKLGIIQDYVEISTFRIRHYLGFRYSLFPSTFYLNITALVYFLKQEKIKYWQLFLLVLGNFFVFQQTNSRLAFISTSLLLFFNLLVKWKPNIFEKFRSFLYPFGFSYIIAGLLSIYAVRSYSNASGFWKNVNIFLGNRLYLSVKSLDIYGIKLWGQRVTWVGNGLDINGYRSNLSYLFVDNMYLNVGQRFGLIAIIAFIILMTIVVFRTLRSQKFVLATILIVIAFHAMIDNLMFELYYNFFWLAIGTELISKNKDQLVS